MLPIMTFKWLSRSLSHIILTAWIYTVINEYIQFMTIDQNKTNRQSTFRIDRGNGSHLLKIFQVSSKKKSTNLFSPMLQVPSMKKMADAEPFMNSLSISADPPTMKSNQQFYPVYFHVITEILP